MRRRTHITLMLGAMLAGLATAVRETAATARAWAIEFALSRSLVSCGLPFVREPRREDEWRGLPPLSPSARPTPATSAASAAPDSFTAAVMARIERRPAVAAPRPDPRIHVWRTLHLIAGTLGVSATITLLSSAALALLAPAEALGLLAALLSLAVLLLALLQGALQLAGDIAANDALMLGLGLALGAVIVVWSRSVRVFRPLPEA